MRFTELIDTEFDLEGAVSPAALLGVRQAGRTPADAVSITIAAYLQMFEDLAVQNPAYHSSRGE